MKICYRVINIDPGADIESALNEWGARGYSLVELDGHRAIFSIDAEAEPATASAEKATAEKNISFNPFAKT